MRQRAISTCFLAVTAMLFTSCAYMQSHKNVEEWGTHYVGCELTPDNIELCSKGGKWYIAAPQVSFERRYPLFNDMDYLGYSGHEPIDSKIEGSDNGSKIYLPISAGTAHVLQRPDGYSQLKVLVDESVRSGEACLNSLPEATKHRILAQIDDKKNAIFIQSREPLKPSTTQVVLSHLDQYTVDAVGTVLYNVAVPIMAPFRFFSEFLSED